MKVFVVMNVNGDILGVATSLENAAKVYEDCYSGSCEFGEDKYQEFELDEGNNSEILKLFAKELIPKIEEFINSQDESKNESYDSHKEESHYHFEKFLEFMGIDKRLEISYPVPEKRKKVKLQEELDNF